jgi:hypothetical protein
LTLKAFVVGLPKCGTTTLHRAFSLTGWRSAHWLYDVSETKKVVVAKALYRKHSAGEDPIAELPECDVVTQGDFVAGQLSLWPQMDTRLLESIRFHHPGCLFILNMRDPAKAASSICRWVNLQERLDRLGAPGLLPGEASNPASIERWIAWHYDVIRTWFRARADFLEYDIEDGHAPGIISSRLEIDLPWWGVANSNNTPATSDSKIISG